jgi:hypothetical protein
MRRQKYDCVKSHRCARLRRSLFYSVRHLASRPIMLYLYVDTVLEEPGRFLESESSPAMVSTKQLDACACADNQHDCGGNNEGEINFH